MWQYKEKIEDLITSFTASTAKYRLTCEHLLIPLMLPDNEYTELLNNPSGDIWKGKELSENIHQRLGKSHGAYSRSVTRLQSALLKFARKLGLDPNNEMKARSVGPLVEEHADSISPSGYTRTRLLIPRTLRNSSRCRTYCGRASSLALIEKR